MLLHAAGPGVDIDHAQVSDSPANVPAGWMHRACARRQLAIASLRDQIAAQTGYAREFTAHNLAELEAGWREI
jgi:hypothetical protein